MRLLKKTKTVNIFFIFTYFSVYFFRLACSLNIDISIIHGKTLIRRQLVLMSINHWMDQHWVILQIVGLLLLPKTQTGCSVVFTLSNISLSAVLKLPSQIKKSTKAAPFASVKYQFFYVK